MDEYCPHTRKPHKWKRIGKVTTHENGRIIDWIECKGCGWIMAKDLPVGHA